MELYLVWRKEMESFDSCMLFTQCDPALGVWVLVCYKMGWGFDIHFIILIPINFNNALHGATILVV